MEFSRVVLQNFMSYKLQDFDGLSTPGLTLIEGENLDEGDSNGSGKSSIWDGISWALFGQTIRGLKGDEVVHRGEKADCCVTVDFQHSGKGFSVHRYRGDVTFGDRIRVHVGEVVVEKGTVSLTQEWLLEELGIDFDLFRCTVLFGQGDTFNFVNAGNKSQKEILSKVMRVDFDEKRAKATAKVKEFEAQKNEMQGDILVLESHLVEDPEATWRKRIEDWASEREGRENSTLEEINQNIAKYKKAKAEHDALGDVDYSLKEKALHELEDSVSYWQKEAAKAEAELFVVKKQIGEIESLRVGVLLCESLKAGPAKCPTCLQEISAEEFLETHGKMCERKAEAEEKFQKIQKSFEQVKKTKNNMFLSLSEERDKERIARRLTDQLENWKEALSKGKARLNEIKAETNPFDGMLAEAIAKRKKILVKKATLEAQVEDIVEQTPYYLFWQTAFGDEGIKSFIFDLICSSLTSKTNRYLFVLAGGFASVSFDTQKKLKSGGVREKFDCLVKVGDEQVPYSAFSGGEKTRISLAVDMALADLMGDFYGEKFNVVVFDEQDTYLDAAGRKAYMQLLRELARKKRVFVVAHDSEFKSHFDNVWTIQKKAGISRRVA